MLNIPPHQSVIHRRNAACDACGKREKDGSPRVSKRCLEIAWKFHEISKFERH